MTICWYMVTLGGLKLAATARPTRLLSPTASERFVVIITASRLSYTDLLGLTALPPNYSILSKSHGILTVQIITLSNIRKSSSYVLPVSKFSYILHGRKEYAQKARTHSCRKTSVTDAPLAIPGNLAAMRFFAALRADR